MEIKLYKKPQNVTIIEGFPGLGLIGTITTEYLIKHLNAEPIGYIWSNELMPVAAVHDSKLAQPIELYYDKKHKILLIHVLTDVKGLEWKISNALEKLYKMLSAKEFIFIEGILSYSEDNHKIYVLSEDKKTQNKLISAGLSVMQEGIVVGVTAAMMLNKKKIKSTGLFFETSMQLPDSRSAAKAVEILDKYLNLKVDYLPLIKSAEEMENKLKKMAEIAKGSIQHRKEHRMPTYMG